jgi:hypothetical protein
MAKRSWMNVPSYYDLEAVPEEWEQAAELKQLLELSRVLLRPLMELLGELESEVDGPLSFPDLAAFIRHQIAEGRVAEEQIGWDLSEFWEEPMIAMEYPVSFLKIVGEDVGFDWRRPLLFYQRNAEGAALNGGPAASLENPDAPYVVGD